jgi:8-oxo-dGTP diphosphatase
MTQERPQVFVVGAAIVQGARALVARRSARMSNALKWEFAGGKLEPGESPEQALVREIEEELGLEIEVGAFLARGGAALETRDIVLDVYLARITGGELVLAEHDAARWVGVDELDELDWAVADLPAVEALRVLLTQRA